MSIIVIMRKPQVNHGGPVAWPEYSLIRPVVVTVSQKSGSYHDAK